MPIRPAAQRSLSRRLTVYTFAFTYLLLIGFWSVLFLSLKHGLKQQDEELIRERVHTITTLLDSEHGPSERLRKRVEKEWFESNSGRILVRVLDENGVSIVETPHLSREQAEILKRLDEGPRATRQPRLKRSDSGDGIYQTAVSLYPLSDNTGHTYFIEIALERTSEQHILSRFRTFFIYLLLIGGLASFWCGRAIVRIALRPIRDISTIAARINSDRLDQRFQRDQLPDEFHELASTMNGMLDRLAISFRRLTRFSEDMAHELRTPVNNHLGAMGVALAHERTPAEYRNVLGSGIEECERLKRIIESLLFIARSSDPNQTIEKQKLILEDELRDIVSFYEVSAEDKGIDLHLDADAGLHILGERTHLQRCLGNLLSNSIRHSPERSVITIQAKEDVDRHVVIRVIDQGTGIPASALDRIGERFFRVEPSRSKIYGGTGLGLSIAKSIIEIHGGRFEIQSQVDQGTTVELHFPV